MWMHVLLQGGFQIREQCLGARQILRALPAAEADTVIDLGQGHERAGDRLSPDTQSEFQRRLAASAGEPVAVEKIQRLFVEANDDHSPVSACQRAAQTKQ